MLARTSRRLVATKGNAVRVGDVLRLKGKLMRVSKSTAVKPGKGVAYNALELYELGAGKASGSQQQRLRASETVDVVDIRSSHMTFVSREVRGAARPRGPRADARPLLVFCASHGGCGHEIICSTRWCGYLISPKSAALSVARTRPMGRTTPTHPAHPLSNRARSRSWTSTRASRSR